MPQRCCENSIKVVGRTATQRFQLPSRFELPLLFHATMGPRGSAWSKPADINRAVTIGTYSCILDLL